MTDLVDRLKAYTLPPTVSVLLRDRRPFARLPDAVVAEVAAHFFSTPLKRGLLSDSIRDMLGQPAPVLKSFVRYEAHLNLTECSPELEYTLLALGFEPDDFYELMPTEYTRNFTYAFDQNPDQVSTTVRRNFEIQCRKACEAVQVSRHDGFLEAEQFASTNIRTFPTPIDRVEDPTTMVNFPFAAGRFRLEPVEQFTKSLDALPATKRVDIHVKMAGAVTPCKVGGQTAATRAELAGLLENICFYRIVSISGNTIYTGQYLDGALGRLVFDGLDNYLATARLASSIILEPCILFWRKHQPVAGGFALSPVSSIIVEC